MEEKFKKISELLGSQVIVEENPKSAKKKDERFFMTLLEQLCQIEAATAILSTVGITIEKYENPHNYYEGTLKVKDKNSKEKIKCLIKL